MSDVERPHVRCVVARDQGTSDDRRGSSASQPDLTSNCDEARTSTQSRVSDVVRMLDGVIHAASGDQSRDTRRSRGTTPESEGSMTQL